MIRVEGYAVVCDNDCIADASGHMPASLKSEAEWSYFQNGLDQADVIVLGRKSHVITPNPKGRARLVLTSSVQQAVWEDALTVLWNPSTAPLSLAIEMFDRPVQTLAVTGGKLVFDHFLKREGGYACFHLSRMKDVYLKDGIKLFPALDEMGETPEVYLRKIGYEPGEWRTLDARASVVRWHRED